MVCDLTNCFLENLNFTDLRRLGGEISRVHSTAWHVSQMEAEFCKCEMNFLGTVHEVVLQQSKDEQLECNARCSV